MRDDAPRFSLSTEVTEQLRIVASAIRVGWMVFALPAPARHINVAHMLNAAGHDRVLRRCLRCLRDMVHQVHVDERQQGFITSEGMFVNRYVAHRIALRAGQTTRQPHADSELISADVW